MTGKKQTGGFSQTSWQMWLLYRWFSAHCGCPLWTGRWTIISFNQTHTHSPPLSTVTPWA